MDITRFALTNNRTTLIAVLGIALAGYGAYNQLPRAEDPGFIIRTAQIVTYFPGASPERVEQLVTDRIEKAVKQMPELEAVRSESKTGVSVVFVDIQERFRSMRPIWDSLRRKVDGIRGDLPDGVRGPFVNDEFGDVFGIVVGLTGEGFSYAELDEVAEEIRDEFLRLPDAGKVEISGTQDERIFVEYTNSSLAESGLSPFMLASILESRNIVTPGGSITTGDERITLEPSGSFESLEELQQTVIELPGRGVIYLGDITTIRRGYVDPPTSMVRVNAEPGLAIAISLREGGNITDLGVQVTELVRQLRAIYPIGIEMDFVTYQPSIVDKKVDEFVDSLIQSVLIVLGVMLLTLGLRTGTVVASLIPVTMLASLLVMSMIGIGLDQISLASLIIALGMLVDNAIVMSESVLVRMENGEPAADAAVAAAGELRVPLLIASLTTSAAFLPIFLAKSAVGEYTSSIFKVVSIALLSSWVLSLTMVPLFCVWFLRAKKKSAPAEGEEESRAPTTYQRMLGFALRHRLLTVLVTVVIFFGAMSLFRFIPGIFFPPADRPLLLVDLEMPLGTPIERTQEVVEQLEAELDRMGSAEDDPVEGYVVYVGAGAPRYNVGYGPKPPSPNYAYAMLDLDRFERIAELRPQLEAFLGGIPDLAATVSTLNYGPPVTDPVAVRISGDDLDALFSIKRDVEAKLRDIAGTRNIQDNWGPLNKKIAVDVSQPRARRAGVSNQEIAISLQTVLDGLSVTQYREQEETIPIVLRSVSADRQDLGKIESLNIFSQSSRAAVPLAQVADLELEWQPAKILRRDRRRTLIVTSGVQQGLTASDVTRVLEPWLDEVSKDWPRGFSWELGGEAEASNKANASIVEQLPVAGVIIILLLVGQFNSVRRAAIVSLTVPLGLIGVVVGLLVMRSYFGFMTFLGVISLAGIVINNAIVLLDRIALEEAEGYPRFTAILRASQLRLRPILLTTATTVGGLLPLLLGGGAMFEPMAIAIMFGLVFSTALTLGVVPVLYALFFRVRPDEV